MLRSNTCTTSSATKHAFKWFSAVAFARDVRVPRKYTEPHLNVFKRSSSVAASSVGESVTRSRPSCKSYKNLTLDGVDEQGWDRVDAISRRRRRFKFTIPINTLEDFGAMLARAMPPRQPKRNRTRSRWSAGSVCYDRLKRGERAIRKKLKFKRVRIFQ